MRKILKRILIRTFLTTISLSAALISLILNPQIVFAKKAVYRDFTIYSNDKIPDNYQSAIDYAIEVIKTSEIYVQHQQLNIFLCDGTMYNAIDTKLLGPAMARTVYDNILLKVPADFNKNILVGSNSKRNLKKTIAREAIHFYQMNKYGALKFNPLSHPPTWKLEGYPEYIANQKDLKSGDYNLKNSINKLIAFENTGEYWIETEPGQFDPLVYYKGRVMIEYLIDIKRLSYSEILGTDVTEDKVMNEMTTWYNKQKE